MYWFFRDLVWLYVLELFLIAHSAVLTYLLFDPAVKRLFQEPPSRVGADDADAPPE